MQEFITPARADEDYQYGVELEHQFTDTKLEEGLKANTKLSHLQEPAEITVTDRELEPE